MAEDGEVQAHLDLSREYLASARRCFEAGERAPAHFLAIHALELAIKATLAAATGSVPRTHNVGGEFGRHFRDRVGSDLTRRLNRILGEYDGPRYPDSEAPSQEELATVLETVQAFVEATAPRLVREVGA